MVRDGNGGRKWRVNIQITLSTAAAPAHIGAMTYTDPRAYLYQPGLLDPDAAQRITRDALKACDDGELYLQYRATESFGFDDASICSI
jgi:TldD protein